MLNQASLGLQGGLVISAAPEGAKQLIGQSLTDVTLSVHGDYYCDVFIGGVAALKVYLTPQFNVNAELLAEIYTTRNDEVTVLQTLSYSPAANMTDNTELVATLAASQGEQWMRVKLTHSGSGNATWDQAEVCGR